MSPRNSSSECRETAGRIAGLVQKPGISRNVEREFECVE